MEKEVEHLREENCRTEQGIFETEQFKGSFGFNSKMLNAVKVKTATLDKFQRRGGLVFDEMQLSEHLDLTTAGKIEGFVNLSHFPTAKDLETVADYGFVLLYQPFVGSWTQIIGVFSSIGNVKAEVLKKILVEAIILVEKAGLHVDYFCCDGAPWNRTLWHSFGISASLDHTKCSTSHPADSERSLFFISDFIHLIKCVRSILLKHGFTTHEGRVMMEDFLAAFKEDSSNATLKAMPNVFGDNILRGFTLHEDIIKQQYDDLDASRTFVTLFRDLINVMTSRYSQEALSAWRAAMKPFKKWTSASNLETWRQPCK